MSHKLYQFPGNPRGIAPRIVADICGVNLEFIWTDFQATKKPEYIEKHALGKIPLLETDQGSLFETNAILRYLARKNPKLNLLGASNYEEGLVNQWLDFINTELISAWAQIMYVVYGWVQQTPETLKNYSEGKQKLVKLLQVVDNHLKHNTYLSGDQITVADIALYVWIAPLLAMVLEEPFRKAQFSLIRWFKHIGHHDAVKKHFRKPWLCNREWIQAPQEKGEKQQQQQQQQQQKGEKKQQQQKKEEPKKKEEKKPKKQSEEDVDEQAEAPKAKNPLDLLPPSPFNLFDFKTLFVNATNKQEALDFFFKNFDPKGYSIWYIKYINYEGEGVKLHMTSNMKDSFLQRLDHFRKYAFGVHGVYGEEGNYQIRGIWVWRGTEHPQEIKDLPNYEYNTWDRLDINNDAHKKLITEYWTGFDIDKSVCDGLVARDVNYFK